MFKIKKFEITMQVSGQSSQKSVATNTRKRRKHSPSKRHMVLFGFDSFSFCLFLFDCFCLCLFLFAFDYGTHFPPVQLRKRRKHSPSKRHKRQPKRFNFLNLLSLIIQSTAPANYYAKVPPAPANEMSSPAKRKRRSQAAPAPVHAKNSV